MRTWIAHIAALTSLAMSLAAAVLWTRSLNPANSDQLAAGTPSARYTVRSEGGRLTLFGPPPTGSSAGEAKAKEIVTRLRNDHFRFCKNYIEYRSPRRDIRYIGVTVTAPVEATPAYELGHVPPGEVKRALLSALNDPTRFVAAHVLLTHNVAREWHTSTSEAPDGTTSVVYNGLRVDLPTGAGVRVVKGDLYRNGSANIEVQFRPGQSARVDAVQLPAIREHWHRLLDVPVVSVPHWWIVAAGLVLPAAWCRSRWRRWRRNRRGVCHACGYDLRATPSRCPECGEPAAARGV